MRAVAAFLMTLVVSVATATLALAQGGNYNVRVGDTLRVEVLEDSSLNRNVLVTPDGKISFPLAGTVRSAGQSVGQIERSLTSRLAPNFANPPTVFVSVVGIPERPTTQVDEGPEMIVVYIVGEVAQPGPKEVRPGSTVLQLLSQSGGFTQFAATKRLQLRRKDSATGRERLYKINYRAISQGAGLTTDPVLREGDVLLIPERRLFE